MTLGIFQVQQLTAYVSSTDVTAQVKVAVVTALLSMPSGAVMDQSKSRLFSNLISSVSDTLLLFSPNYIMKR